jgi:hypothetical protein
MSIVFVCCVVLLAGYAWAKVTFDYDHAVDFSGYSTYAWMERDNSIEAQLPEHLRLRLRRVTEDVLADKGLEPSPAPPQTDLLLTFYYGARDELAVHHVAYSSYSPWGYGYWGGFNYGYTRCPHPPVGVGGNSGKRGPEREPVRKEDRESHQEAAKKLPARKIGIRY